MEYSRRPTRGLKRTADAALRPKALGDQAELIHFS
jgi:hypothetical protein